MGLIISLCGKWPCVQWNPSLRHEDTYLIRKPVSFPKNSSCVQLNPWNKDTSLIRTLSCFPCGVWIRDVTLTKLLVHQPSLPPPASCEETNYSARMMTIKQSPMTSANSELIDLTPPLDQPNHVYSNTGSFRHTMSCKLYVDTSFKLLKFHTCVCLTNDVIMT